MRSLAALSAQRWRFIVISVRDCRLKLEEQKPLPVIYKDVKLDCGYRLDLVVEDEIIVEIKAVEKLLPIHEAQILSYCG